MKNPNDPIGNRTCDLPACTAVPEPSAPPRTALVVFGHIASVPAVPEWVTHVKYHTRKFWLAYFEFQ
jgi:hypothetical protein